MWKRVFKRFGRELVSIIVAGLASYVSGQPWALIAAPIIGAFGKWMRERGFQDVPF